VEDRLRTLDAFAKEDVAALYAALRKAGRAGYVPGADRDALFIRARHG
jgi:hypothetical protein